METTTVEAPIIDGDKILTINVGGRTFTAYKKTFYQSLHLKELLEMHLSSSDSSEPLFVNYSGDIFGHVFNYLMDINYVISYKYVFAFEFFNISFNPKEIDYKKRRNCEMCKVSFRQFLNEKSFYCASCKCPIIDCDRAIQLNDYYEKTTIKYQYCKDHTCIMKYCNAGADFDSACVKHRCTLRDCNNSQEHNSTYCFDHACRKLGCPKKKKYGNFCSKHVCFVDKCNNENTHRSAYCYLHACQNFNCRNLRFGTMFCIEHKCEFEYCQQSTYYQARYCVEHECGINDCASHISTSGSMLCNFHEANLCTVKGCKNKRVDNETTCSNHCVKKVKNVTVSIQDQKCHFEKCRKKSEAGKDFCVTHLCKAAECNNLKVNQNYCLTHTFK